jgi:uncharacterized membrane protein YphA (DoxX/SURF4 family)
MPNADSRLLRCSVAFVWLFTGLAVVFPYYRDEGHKYLDRLGLPDWLMYLTCAAEVLLGLRVALGPASTWVTLVQVVLVLGFTTILACLDPLLLAHPFGILTKNIPLLSAVGTAWLLEREGWTSRARWLLRVGMAIIWITEGIFPKLFFQQSVERQLVEASGLVPADPAGFLIGLGTLETCSGLLALLLRGRLLRWLLACQLFGLVVLPVLASLPDLRVWVHPFGPLTKNVPIIAGTYLVMLRCTDWTAAVR